MFEMMQFFVFITKLQHTITKTATLIKNNNNKKAPKKTYKQNKR